MTQGTQLFQHGSFAEAARSWLEAARIYEHATQPRAHRNALIHLSQAYQALGQYRRALQALTTAQTLAEQADDRRHRAAVFGSLGTAYLALGVTDDASRALHQGLQLAEEVGDTGLLAGILNNLGNLFALQSKHKEALNAYTKSLTFATQTANHALAARALINAAREAMDQKHYRQAKEWLGLALGQLQHVEPSHDKTYSLINLGLAHNALRSRLPDAHDALLLQAAEAFTEAARIAQASGDIGTESYAWGYLGALYEQQRRYAEALELTRRAVFTAQQRHIPESLYRWQWQTGRLLNTLGDLDEAIAAYRRAVDTLQSLRQEISHGRGRSRLSSRERVQPVYFELVDLLLRRSASLHTPSESTPYLSEAREMVERLKAVELRDYFQDDCVDTVRVGTTSLDDISQTAVVIYPILLPDRTELLVALPTGLKRFTVPVDRATLTKEIRAFRRTLVKQTTHQYVHHAKKLYDWLIRPLEADLASVDIDTLVFVPDGPLRTIPMAALYDAKREQFLISQYALAITPALNLTDPRPLPRSDAKLLAMGLSAAVQNFSPLPNVTKEIGTIKTFYDSETLLDQTFLLANAETMLEKKPFSIVHIASHAQFHSNVKDTFLLTFDGKLTLDRLEEIIGVSRFRDEPLELLMLSACQTAAGDDRAALGLAGIAIKAGARSAIATLWSVNDEASAELVITFYRQLKEHPSMSRATALQRAQLRLLNELGYDHPSYWAPFLLINNWL